MTEGIEEGRVTGWMKGQIPDLEAPMSFDLITGGHSNLTYRCRDISGKAFVLRRPPLGHVLESAHDMGREHKIIDALQGSKVPVPKTYGLCRDKSINGADFYLMGFVDGNVLNDSVSGLTIDASDRAALGEHVIHILCDLHAVDIDAVGLGDLGRKEAYLARQLNRWSKQWIASKTHEIPAMEASQQLLAERMPEQRGASIVHGDFRLGNMIVEGQRVKAILDWELCTLGDPLADLAYALNVWPDPTDPEPPAPESATSPKGFHTRTELAERYQSKTNRDLSQLDYYVGFNRWKSACILHGVYARYCEGKKSTDGIDLDEMRERITRTIDLSERAVNRLTNK